MAKILLGLVAGLVLGVLDGLTAWFDPAFRAEVVSIAVGSGIKGLFTGLLAGWCAKRWNSTGAALLGGFVAGVLLSYAVAFTPDENGDHYYIRIMLPGAIIGLIAGFLAQRFGKGRQPVS